MAAPSVIYDVRQRTTYGRKKTIALTVDSRTPTVLAIAANYPPRIEIVGPTQILLGNEGKYEVSLAAGSAKSLSVLHVSLIDPLGKEMEADSLNLIPSADKSRVSFIIKSVKSDQIGTWLVRVADLGLGASAIMRIKFARS